MAKILFFNFDGTDNEPADAMQDRHLLGGSEDSSISNVLKFHLLLGGRLTEEAGHTELDNGSHTFYFSGVGTYGNYFERKFNAGLARESADVSTILRRAKKYFREHYEKAPADIDYIVVTGFSRGAALARRFAAIINNQLKRRQILVECVFDTVASIGLPNLRPEDRPSTEVVFEHGQTLPSNVYKAVHIVSLDDRRRAFQPTLMNRDERVLEVWFPGAHSDVGGGYNFDGLSDSALRFALDWFEDEAQAEMGVRFLSSKTIRYGSIFPEGSKLQLGADDVQIDPNPLGISHQQDRIGPIERFTLCDRRCCVIEHDEVVPNGIPLVHGSAVQRIGADRNYRPKALENLTHEVLYPNQSRRQFKGYSDHKLSYKRNLQPATSKGLQTRAYAHLKFNHTGILLQAGKSYRIEVLPGARWRDGSIKELDGAGWDRGDVRFGIKEAAIAAAEPFRRVTGRGAKWFTLCGCVGDSDRKAIVIGNKRARWKVKESGELCVFANDLDGYYGNNSGYLNLLVTLLESA